MNPAARIHDHAAQLLRRVKAFHEAVATGGESEAAATPASPRSPRHRLGPFPRFERHERPTGRAA